MRIRLSRSIAFFVTLTLVLCSASAAQAQFKQLFEAPGAADAEGDPQVTVKLTPEEAKPGDEVVLSIAVEIPAGIYTYSTNKSFGGCTRFKLKTEGLEALGEFEADHPPKVEYSEDFKQDLEKYKGHVTWSRKFRVLPGTEQATIKGQMEYQVCNARNCRQLRHDVDVSVSVAGGGPPVFATEVTPGRGKETPLKLDVRLVTDDRLPGSEATLQITAFIEKGWHTYSTKDAGQDGDNQPTVIDVEKVVGLKPLEEAFTADHPPELKESTEGGQLEVYHDKVTWSRRYQLTGSLEDVRIKGLIINQVCTNRKCLIPTQTEFSLPVMLAAAAPQVARGGAEVQPPGAGPNVEQPEAPATIKGLDANDPRAQGLGMFLLTAFLAGFAALLTPCVFPMVPITVSFFLKQSEKQHHRPITMASIYCLSIMATFTVLGLVVSFLFGATTITQWANGVWLNLFLAVVLTFFAFNLLGMFEIRIPSWLLTYTAGKESAGGFVGVLFMALTFTLTSFTCTFAFLGLILVWSAKGQFFWPLLGLLAFSFAFSLPFFFLALFPSYLQKLPKSGGWMNNVKVVMGLIELAFMFKFLSVADVSWHGQPTLFDFHFVMSTWLIISITAGMYLLGLFRLPHDTPRDHIGVIPLVIAMSFLGFGGYLATGLFGSEPPKGWLWQTVAGFAPASFEAGQGDEGPFVIGEHDHLKYLLDFKSSVKVASHNDQPLFVDFTGVNCVNCRIMELRMSQPEIRERLERLVRVQLYLDTIPAVAATNSEEAERLIVENTRLATEWIGSVSMPSYAIVSSDGKTILSTYEGLAPDMNEFKRFLDKGLQRWAEGKKSGTLMTQAR
jgi:thiol:disulfide interchange protein DsbD